MDETFILWTLPLAVTLHNLEEAIWLPDWSQEKASRWYQAVGAWPFRFAVVVLTITVLLLAILTQSVGWGSVWHYLLASYALGQGLNVFIPHLAATLKTGSYAPGLLSGILFVLPSATFFLTMSLLNHQLETIRFIVTAATFIPAMLLSIPMLFRLGKYLHQKG